MIWRDLECHISDNLVARIWSTENGSHWYASVRKSGGGPVWTKYAATEELAKRAVCHWIGKTMAQFSNALAAGCNDVDDGN